MEVIVDKVDLLQRLKENRQKHEENFKLAYEGYTQTLMEELEQKLAEVQAGRKNHRVNGQRLLILNIPPECHLDDYDEVIDMLEMADDKQIKLSQQQFRQYARDDWGWKQQWTASTAEYVAKASGR